MKKNFIISFLICFTVSIFGQGILSAPVVDKLSKAVYEVVVLKPGEGNIEYEKRLPLERIAYSVRMDKYLPIGTAFLMEDGKFYSAAHVVQLRGKSLYKDYFIRDRDGKTYPIDKIEKFSINRDFVVFSVKNLNTGSLEKLKSVNVPAMNTQVYSVGNALGEGIVIRDGVLTSQTFEDVNGEWKWLRFSAAASPGNSGGPLVDKEGNVLGIITMKSQNENLNYALPFGETKNVPDNTGIVFIPSYYNMPNITTEKFYNIYEHEISLPKTLADTQKEVVSYIEEYTEKLIDEKIRAVYNPSGEKGFLKDEPYTGLLDSAYALDFPSVLCINSSEEWGLYSPNNVKDTKLQNEGTVSYGTILGYGLAYLKKPDTDSLEDLLKTPKKYVDYVIKGIGLTRNVGGETIRITSLGEPVEEETFTDSLGRKWFTSYFELPFTDAVFMSMALPVPEGLVVFTCLDVTSEIYTGHNYDLKFIADYVFPKYTGTVSEWKEFLSLPEELYPKYNISGSVKIEKIGIGLNIKVEEICLNIPENLYYGDDEVSFCLSMGYENKDNKYALSPLGVNAFYESLQDKYFSVYIIKNRKPGKNAPVPVQEAWLEKSKGKGSYNGKAFEAGGYRYINEIIKGDENSETVYEYSLRQNESVKAGEFKKNSKNILKNSSVE